GCTARGARHRRSLPRNKESPRALRCPLPSPTGAPAKAALPGLTAALASPEAEMRIAAAQALGRFGRDAAAATRALVAALDGTNVAVRQAASEALLAIGE